MTSPCIASNFAFAKRCYYVLYFRTRSVMDLGCGVGFSVGCAKLVPEFGVDIR